MLALIQEELSLSSKGKIDVKKQSDNATAFGISAVFFVAAWMIYLFPETILNFYPETISKLLLAFSFLWLVNFDNNRVDGINGHLSDLGIGLGSLIIFISFVNVDSAWNINIFLRLFYKTFIWIFFIIGVFGTSSGIYKAFSEVAIAKDNKKQEKTNNIYQQLLDLTLKILQVIIAIYTIIEFTGLNK